MLQAKCTLYMNIQKHNGTRHTKVSRTKDHLDVTCYFISLLRYSTCFGH